MKCKLLSNNVGGGCFEEGFSVEASVALQVLGMLHSLPFDFLAIKKQMEKKED